MGKGWVKDEYRRLDGKKGGETEEGIGAPLIERWMEGMDEWFNGGVWREMGG